MIPILWGITLISFLVIHLAPGEPTGLMGDFNPKITKEARERLRAYYGLDKPLHIQYLIWTKKVLTLDFGRSFAPDQRPVIEKIMKRIPITLTINLLSLALIFFAAIPIGIYCARHHGSFGDKFFTMFVFIGYAIPSFWLALMLIALFGVKLGWLPVSGIKSVVGSESMGTFERFLDVSKHLLLPILVSAFGGLAGLARYMRSSLIEVLNQEYILAARAKGLPEKTVIYKHALRNALLPVITILGLSVPGLIGGSVIFESIFSIPGMGQLFYYSVMARDYPVIMGIVVIGAVLTLLGNLLADIAYAIADPRIRVE
jgi:peptide/nickel transport system permease protein